MNPIKNLIRGNKLFRKYHFDEFKDDLQELNTNGQNHKFYLFLVVIVESPSILWLDENLVICLF